MPSQYDTANPIVQALQASVAALESIANKLQDSMGAQRLPGSGDFAFRRLTDPLFVPVSAVAQKFTVPPDFFDEGKPGWLATSFYVVNPNACYVRLRGTSKGTEYQAVTSSTGWLFQPGFSGAFSTQYPIFMSALAVPMPGVPLPADFVPIEISYGGGT